MAVMQPADFATAASHDPSSFTALASKAPSCLILDQPMSLELDHASRRTVAEACQSLINHTQRVTQALASSFGGLAQPPELRDLFERAAALRDVMSQPGEQSVAFDFDDDEAKVIRTALSLHRREMAERIERALQRVTSNFLSRELQASLIPLDGLLSCATFAGVKPRPLPALAEFLTPEARQQHEMVPSLAAEAKDPKHGILLSASLIAGDVSVFRKHCEDRGVPFATVFADLDDFKMVNTELGEVVVDRMILPRILSTVEAATYGHGRAYRHGGDEFVVLIPNASVEVVSSLVLQLKTAVEELSFDSTSFAPKLSAGVWITVPASHLTAMELVTRASEAKAASKGAGKNRITIRSEIGSGYTELIVK